MNKPICPECKGNNGIYPLKDGLWHCGDCNYSFEDEGYD